MIKTGFFFYFLEMLKKIMDFIIKSRYGQVVLNKPVFFQLIVYQWSVIRQSSATLSNLNISEASWPILIKFYV